jgi:hypothetical protein
MFRRRSFDVFTLSFLDCIACGFGAVVLLFFIINHSSEVRSDELNRELLAEAARLEQQVLEGEKNRVRVRNALREINAQQITARGRARQVIQNIEKTKLELAALDKETLARQRHIHALAADLKSVEEQAKRLEGSVAADQDQGDAIRTVVGQGDRQYLTGLKVGGERILILIDASTSMLDDTIVNIIRRRNLPDAQKLAAPKWQRAIATVDWITAQIPVGSQFQIYTFNVDATPLLEGTNGKWQSAEDGRQLSRAVENLRKIIPQQGTSLHRALGVIRTLSPRPDTIYLLTDGLPTQGESEVTEGLVSGETRLGFFQDALSSLPIGIPVNVILLPMEGDPMAASAYWRLAQVTGGSFLSPSSDWP